MGFLLEHAMGSVWIFMIIKWKVPKKKEKRESMSFVEYVFVLDIEKDWKIIECVINGTNESKTYIMTIHLGKMKHI